MNTRSMAISNPFPSFYHSDNRSLKKESGLPTFPLYPDSQSFEELSFVLEECLNSNKILLLAPLANFSKEKNIQLNT